MADNVSPRPEQQFFDDPALDRLMGVVMSLATEHAVLRDRVRALECELEQAGRLDRARLDAAPTEEERVATAAEQAEFAAALLEPLRGEQQALGAGGRFTLAREKSGRG